MSDIVLSSVDLDVFGGPSAVDVSVDFGATGARGSRIWMGSTDPDTELIGQDVKIYDVYINKVSKEMFQYIEQVGSPAWISTGSLGLAEAKEAIIKNFTSGYAWIGVLYPKDKFVLDDFVTQVTVEPLGAYATHCVSTGIKTSIAPFDASYDIYYVEMWSVAIFSGVWYNLSGNHKVHISVVAK